MPVSRGPISVNDQVTSGYFDVGNMRMMWGVATSTGVQQTVTLPAAFANTSWRFTSSPSGNLSIMLVTTGVKTTTSIITNAIIPSTGLFALAGFFFDWMAVGQKP